MTDSEKQDELVVIDHHHDSNAGLYRLTLGVPIEREVEKRDENGELVPGKVPLMGPDGEVAKDVDGKEVWLPGGFETETITDHIPIEDFVFADDDEKYKGKSATEIAKSQRAEVKRTLAKRRKDAEAADESAPAQLPGSGDAL